MKKVFFAAAFIAGTALMTSCKKDYTCECTADGATYTYELKDVKKGDADDACDSAGNVWILAGGTCELK
ncbi:hypothetical protein [Crocinitomix algicola]|uniref:hypothetical protein n=1 Tax=Crocinitomix algicola TaxID=1740263 RepID=UPI000872E092|nr:hypothetical protein [Crocinitomix algicola]